MKIIGVKIIVEIQVAIVCFGFSVIYFLKNQLQKKNVGTEIQISMKYTSILSPIKIGISSSFNKRFYEF